MSADDTTEQQDVESVPDVEPTSGVEIDKVTAAADETQQDDEGKLARWRRLKPGPVALVLALLLSGGLAAWLYFEQFRPDQQTDDAATRAAVDAARDGTVALLSYKPDTLNRDFAAAKSHLTGGFLNYYDQFTKQVVTPAATQKAVTTTAQVVGAAASEMHPDLAVVLVFVNQVTTSKDRPDPAMASSSVLVSMTKVHGVWLITKFDPI
jgi:Mce-associated membrane protein